LFRWEGRASRQALGLLTCRRGTQPLGDITRGTPAPPLPQVPDRHPHAAKRERRGLDPFPNHRRGVPKDLQRQTITPRPTVFTMTRLRAARGILPRHRRPTISVPVAAVQRVSMKWQRAKANNGRRVQSSSSQKAGEPSRVVGLAGLGGAAWHAKAP
jgi:hypothetical protein